jgi:predicted amidohydrolase
MQDLHIACGQFAAEPEAKSKNTAHMIAQAESAQKIGCQLILFPELIVSGYLSPERVKPLAEPLNGPSVQALSKAARGLGIAIAFGMAELHEPTQTRYNSLVVLNQNGEIAGVYRKMHLWGSEKEWAQKGETIALFEVAGVRASGWICYDTRFPEVGRLAALAGADVGLVATAWLGPGEEWEVCLRARALDNSLFVAGADIISYDPMLRCWGRSMIISPKGKILAQANPEQEGIIDAVLNGEELEAQRNRVPLLKDRFPSLYRALVK